MTFDSETIEKKFQGLPAEVQNILTSQEIADSISRIGESFGLHVDQIGILFQETTYFLLGLETEPEYESNVIRSLNIERDEADKIIAELNDKVFLPIRHLMQKDVVAQKPAVDSSAIMNKSDILAEIENPTPVEHPISIAKEVPAFPMAREITPEKLPEKSKEAVAHDFINEKLTGTVNLAPQNAPTAPEKPKGYTSDPYREPLI